MEADFDKPYVSDFSIRFVAVRGSDVPPNLSCSAESCMAHQGGQVLWLLPELLRII